MSRSHINRLPILICFFLTCFAAIPHLQAQNKSLSAVDSTEQRPAGQIPQLLGVIRFQPYQPFVRGNYFIEYEHYGANNQHAINVGLGFTYIDPMYMDVWRDPFPFFGGTDYGQVVSYQPGIYIQGGFKVFANPENMRYNKPALYGQVIGLIRSLNWNSEIDYCMDDQRGVIFKASHRNQVVQGSIIGMAGYQWLFRPGLVLDVFGGIGFTVQRSVEYKQETVWFQQQCSKVEVENLLVPRIAARVGASIGWSIQRKR